MALKPVNHNDAMYHLLRDGNVKEFNRRKSEGQTVDLRNCDLRGLDLRGLDADGIDFSGCYFRQADLRGVDFRNSRMEGVSINGAKISGTYFPEALDAAEITLSLTHGVRMRWRGGP